MRLGVLWFGLEMGVLVVVTVGGYVLWDRHQTFVPTDEVFQDPVTGRHTWVYEDPTNGKRQYREEP